jgi:hypothetical protein
MPWLAPLCVTGIRDGKEVPQPIGKDDLGALGRRVITGVMLNGGRANVRINRGVIVAAFLGATLLLTAGALVENIIRPRTDIAA